MRGSRSMEDRSPAAAGVADSAISWGSSMPQSADYSRFAQRWHELMQSGMNHAHRYLEKPAMLAKVPDLRGKYVLALGCGTGEECTMLLDRGATRVTGVDQSKAVLALARKTFESDPRVDFACMDMHR